MRQGQSWVIGVAGHWSVGGMDSDVQGSVKTIAKKAVKEWGS